MVEKKSKPKGMTTEYIREHIKNLYEDRHLETLKGLKDKNIVTFKGEVDENNKVISHRINKFKGRIPKEPNFIKLYLDDAVVLTGLKKYQSNVLIEIASFMRYNDYIVSLSSYDKKVISKRLGFKGEKTQQIDNAIQDLKKAGLLLPVIDEDTGKLVRGSFEINPYIFGKGDWERNWINRGHFKLEVLYKRNENGRYMEMLKTKFRYEEGGNNE